MPAGLNFVRLRRQCSAARRTGGISPHQKVSKTLSNHRTSTVSHPHSTSPLYTAHRISLYLAAPRSHTMKGYAIFTREKTLEPAEMALYMQQVAATFAGHEMNIRASYRKHEDIEG